MWGLFPYRLFMANADGSDRVALTDDNSYNAEGSFHPHGDRVLFTTTRWGNIDLAELNLRTKRIRRLTTEIGYNDGPFYSWDGRYIVYRAYHPYTNEEIKEFQDLLRQRLVRPSKLELWVMTADGKRKRCISQLGQANFAPFMKPGNRQVIFTSNHHDPRGREFDLFLMNLDGTGVQQITYTGDFDGFRCSRATASGWCGRPTALQKRAARRISISPTGWSRLPSPQPPLPQRGRRGTRADPFGVLKRQLQRWAEAPLPHSTSPLSHSVGEGGRAPTRLEC
jgi:hypothetical protein